MESNLKIVALEITSACNLNCPHCRGNPTQEKDSGELSTQEITSLLEELAETTRPMIILSGGEPLLRKDLFQIAHYGTKLGLRMSLATNGTLVTQEIAREIKRARISRVSVSIDGADANSHDSFRNEPGSFARAFEGIEKLKGGGVEFQINSTITGDNINQIEDLFNLARSLGARAFHLFLLVPTGKAILLQKSQITAEEYEKVLVWLCEKTKEIKDDFQLKATCAPHFFRVAHMQKIEPIPQLKPSPLMGEGRVGVKESPSTNPSHPARGGSEETLQAARGRLCRYPFQARPWRGRLWRQGRGILLTRKGCLAGISFVFISSKGDVFPCGYLPVLAGNIRRQSFNEIWSNAEVFKNLRNIDKLQGKCGICDYKIICGGCRARAYAETGNYLSEEPLCIYQPTKGRKNE